MPAVYRKFATRADPKVLDEVRAIAAREGKKLHTVIDEALRDLIDKRRRGTPRSNVLMAFGESLSEHDTLYKKLAK